MIRNRATVIQIGIVVVGTLAALAGGAVLAANAAKPSFEALDKNSDGKLSLNEAAENDTLFVAFKGLDTNKDGALSREEFAAFQKDKPPA